MERIVGEIKATDATGTVYNLRIWNDLEEIDQGGLRLMLAGPVFRITTDTDAPVTVDIGQRGLTIHGVEDIPVYCDEYNYQMLSGWVPMIPDEPATNPVM